MRTTLGSRNVAIYSTTTLHGDTVEKMLPPPNESPQSPSDDQTSIEQLRDVVASLQAQIAQLDRRLSNLEQSCFPSAVTSANLEQLPPAKPRLESRFGLTVLNRVGAITLAIGIIFFFKYAVDSRWIGAAGRITLGIIAGLAMILASEALRKRSQRSLLPALDQSIFTQGIVGCGLATIYVSLYASFAYYELILKSVGFFFLVAASVLAILLSIRYASPAIAALGFMGGLLTALLLHSGRTGVWLDFFYLLLLGGSAILLAVRQNWPVLVPLIAAMTMFTAGYLFNTAHPGWFAVFCLCLAAMHFAGARNARDDARLRNFAYIAAHGCLLVALMRIVGTWAVHNSSPSERSSFVGALESFLLALYGVFALTYGIIRKLLIDRWLGIFLLCLLIAKLYLWDVWQLDRFYRISAFVLLGVLLLGASYIYSQFRSRASDRW
jgi:uncharacterized membrane protein